jgi:UDP-N-acetylglucosamine:LPS N-acetylglucosamine transferase
MLRTITQLVKDGHSACVILPYDGLLVNALTKAGARVEIVPCDSVLRKRNLRSPLRLVQDSIKGYRAYTRIAYDVDPDLISSNTSVTFLGGLLARKLGVPHVCHVRESYEGFGLLWLIYRRFLLRV